MNGVLDNEEPVPISEEDVVAVRKLAYEQGIARLSSQTSALESVRQRSAGFMALNMGVASFLGKSALESGFGVLEIHAIEMMILGILFHYLVLRPQHGWLFENDANVILSEYAGKHSLSESYDYLARYMSENAEKNEDKLKSLMKYFNRGAICVALQIGFWLLNIGFSEELPVDSSTVVLIEEESHEASSEEEEASSEEEVSEEEASEEEVSEEEASEEETSKEEETDEEEGGGEKEAQDPTPEKSRKTDSAQEETLNATSLEEIEQ